MTKALNRALQDFVADQARSDMLAKMIVIEWARTRDNANPRDAHVTQTPDAGLPDATEYRTPDRLT